MVYRGSCVLFSIFLFLSQQKQNDSNLIQFNIFPQNTICIARIYTTLISHYFKCFALHCHYTMRITKALEILIYAHTH